MGLHVIRSFLVSAHERRSQRVGGWGGLGLGKKTWPNSGTIGEDQRSSSTAFFRDRSQKRTGPGASRSREASFEAADFPLAQRHR